MASKANYEADKFIELAPRVTSVRVNTFNSLVTDAFDSIAITYPTSTTEVYTYKSGGLTGTTVSTITLTYSDSSKETLTSVERT